MNHRLWSVVALSITVVLNGTGLRAQQGRVSGNTPPKTSQAWTLEQARRQMALNPHDPYLQYVALQLAANEHRTSEVASAIEATARRGADRDVDLFALFTGALAVQESLQLDAMRPADAGLIGQMGDRSHETVKTADLVGPQVKSHPWGKMLAAQTLAGKSPEVSPLAKCVPEDQYFVLFGSVDKLLDASELGDLWGAHLFSQTARSAKTQQTTARLKRQLAVQTDPLTRPFYDMVIEEVAITGSDLYFRTGSDVTLLFRIKQPEVFRLRMDGFLAAAEQSRPDAARTTGKVLGVDYVHVATPDRDVHVFSAYPRPDLHVRSNSKAGLQRVLETIAGRSVDGRRDVRPLGDSTEFKYIRTLMPRGAKEEDGFVYLSDPFIRRVVGAELKLTQVRRLLCYNHLRMIGHAAMLYRTQYGRPADSLNELAAAGCTPGLFGEGRFRCPCGGEYTLSEDGTTGACSHHGHARYLVPCCEIPLARVTEAEAKQYRTFVDRYNRYWRRFFDPIAIRIRLTPKQYRAETIILPLIDNSIYSGMAMTLGGEPEPLDGLPVPKRNIFSVAVKVDKERLLEEAGWSPPGPEARQQASREADLRASANNLKRIGLAMHNYHATYRQFPAVANFDRSKRPLLSWRVHLLPYLEQTELYRQFRLDEPWDSQHNKKLIERMPWVYDSPGRKARRPGTTTYLLPVGRAALFTGTGKQFAIRDVRDGTSNTIMVVDAAEKHAVVWTKPDDLDCDRSSIAGALFGRFGDVGLVGFADGSVRRLPKTMNGRSLDALFTRAGGERVTEVGQGVPSRRRDPFGINELTDGKLDQRQLYDFVTRGVGNQIGMHVYDASPFFDFNLTGFLGEMMGSFGDPRMSFDDDFIPIGFLIASLNSPVYVAVSVKDAQIVDKFLDHLDLALAELARQPQRGGFLDLDFDFYRVPLGSGDERIRCYNVRFGPIKWRVFFARIGDGLYIASKRFILEDLAAADEKKAESGPIAHAMVRIRPEHWDQVLPNFQLGWAESSRQSCLNNLGPLSSVARAVGAAAEGPVGAAEVCRRADMLHGVHFFCPDGGRYELSPDGKQIVCTAHGSAIHPRQMSAPAKGSPMGRLMQEFAGVTAALTFLEDGLHAVVTVDRK